MYKPLILVLILCLIWENCTAQKPPLTENSSYKDLFRHIKTYHRDDLDAFPFIQLLIDKAKEEGNSKQLYYSYRKASSYAPEHLELLYVDSMVWAARNTKDSNIIGKAILSKGIKLNSKRKYDKALQHYLIAEKYFRNSKDTVSKMNLLFAIGQIKNYLGIYDDAILLIDSANKYYGQLRNRNDTAFYLMSLNALKDINVQTGHHQEATRMYFKGKEINAYNKDDVKDAYLDLYEGFNQYELKNYQQSIDYINASLPALRRREDFSRLAMADFYLGLNYLELGKYKLGIQHLRKMDSVFVKENYTRPRFRKAYSKLIEYYKSKNNAKEQLWAINQALAIEKTLNSYFKSLSTTLKKKYDSQILIREKELLETSLKVRTYQTKLWIGGLVLLGLLTFSFGIVYYIRVLKYKRLYNDLLNQENNEIIHVKEISNSKELLDDNVSINRLKQNSENEDVEKSKSSILSQELVQQLTKQINQFESKKDYLQKGLTQYKLANSFKTNNTYLSAYINTFKGKNFTSYINDLRIKYLTQLLRTNKKYQNYTIEALAEEVGYGSAKTLSRIFKENKGFPISYFLQKIREEAK